MPDNPPEISNLKSEIASASPPSVPSPDPLLNSSTALASEGRDPTSLQYEALCRHAISRLYLLPISEIHTGRLTGASRNRTHTQHQIDLHWTVSDGVCNYLLFANAKWHSPYKKVSLPDLMTLVGVWHDIGAHKAMLITNTAFHTGVITQAKEKGIALLIVRPTEFFTPSSLPRKNTPHIQQAIEDQSALHPTQPLFTHQIIHRAFAPPFLPALSKVAGPAPALSNVEGPALSQAEGPALSQAEGSVPSCLPQDDFTYLIESAAPSEHTFDNKMLDDSTLTNRMIQNAPNDDLPPPPPFGLRTK